MFIKRLSMPQRLSGGSILNVLKKRQYFCNHLQPPNLTRRLYVQFLTPDFGYTLVDRIFSKECFDSKNSILYLHHDKCIVYIYYMNAFNSPDCRIHDCPEL